MATTFTCTCKGCRRRTAAFNRIDYGADSLAAELQGYYFSADTRRFFRSRVLRVVILPRDGIGGAAIVESKAGDMDNSYRKFCVTHWCKYGTLVDRDQFGNEIKTEWLTGKPAHRYAADTEKIAAVIAGCDCHGCTLDREGR